MVKFKVRKLYGVNFSIAILSVIIMSWLLYPFAVSWVFPNSIRLGFILLWSTIFFWVSFSTVKIKFRPSALNKYERYFFIGISIYFGCLFLATFVFNDGQLYYFMSYIMKYVFLIFLLLALTKKHIVWSFRLYMYLCGVLVCFSMINIVGLYNQWWGLEELEILQGVEFPRVVWFSWSGYDGMARVFSNTPNLFRIQSYSIEPGSFALALLPAIYWAVFVEKNKFIQFILMSGLCATWSLGALLALVMVILLLVLIRPSFYKESILTLCFGVFLFLAGHWLLTQVVESTVGESTVGESTVGESTVGESTVGNRSASLMQRIEELMTIRNFLNERPEGAGAGEGRRAAQSSLSIGYGNVFVDAGVLGGLAYLIAYFILVIGVISRLWHYRKGDGLLCMAMYAIGFSLLTGAFFGFQREQPDASFWMMWILASFIVISKRVR